MAKKTLDLTITGYSTARWSTWYFVDQFGLLFDAGDGVAAHLGGKCEKVRHVFLSHADRDHLGGLIQLYQLAARQPSPPCFYFPKDSGSFPALRDFLERFDPNLARCEWTPIERGMRIEIARDLLVEIDENDHIAAATGGDPALVKSLDFVLIQTRRKLRSEFHGIDGTEIARIRAERGEDHLTQSVERRLLGYSGDTRRFDPERWHDTEVLIHEATFIMPDAADRGHCEIGEVINSAAALNLQALILGHVSNRYKANDILAAIRKEAGDASVQFPIYALLPGTVSRDLLAEIPVWNGE